MDEPCWHKGFVCSTLIGWIATLQHQQAAYVMYLMDFNKFALRHARSIVLVHLPSLHLRVPFPPPGTSSSCLPVFPSSFSPQHPQFCSTKHHTRLSQTANRRLVPFFSLLSRLRPIYLRPLRLFLLDSFLVGFLDQTVPSRPSRTVKVVRTFLSFAVSHFQGIKLREALSFIYL